MKKFFTIISGQGILDAYQYKAVDNQKLNLDSAISFPILCAFAGYVEPKEKTEIVTVIPKTEKNKANYETFQKQLAEICKNRELEMPIIHEVWIEDGQEVGCQLKTFQKVIDCTDDNDELFCDMTFGTKPQSQMLIIAVQYAFRLKQNASLSCVVYGEVKRPSLDKTTWYGNIYDMTALIRLDEVIRLLAENKIDNPKAILEAILK